MIVFQVSFDPAKEYWKYEMSDLYFNGESDYSEAEFYKRQWRLLLYHSSAISVWAWSEKTMFGNESHEKDTTEAAVHRYSSK